MAQLINTLLAYFVPVGGGGTLIVYAIRAYLKRRSGNLSRADLLNARAERAEKLNVRYRAYAWRLIDKWPQGHPRPPWPRNLPKE